MGTGASMIVKNQTSASFTTTLSNLNCMYQNGDDGSELQQFNNLTLQPYSDSGFVYVEADGSFFGGCSTSQSSFQINYLNGSMGINLGTAPLYDTSTTSNSNPAQIQAVLAPNTPVLPGVSYNFYLYGGPGVLAPLVNSAINANLPALASAVAQSPLVVYSNGTLKVSLSAVNFSTLTCPYAAVIPAGDNQLQFSIILSATGTVTGTVSSGSMSTAMDVSVSDLVVLLEGTLTLSASATSASASLFACSLGSYSINQALLEWLITLPLWALLNTFATAPDVAGVINGTGLNDTILQAINQALAKI